MLRMAPAAISGPYPQSLPTPVRSSSSPRKRASAGGPDIAFQRRQSSKVSLSWSEYRPAEGLPPETIAESLLLFISRTHEQSSTGPKVWQLLRPGGAGVAARFKRARARVRPFRSYATKDVGVGRDAIVPVPLGALWIRRPPLTQLEWMGWMSGSALLPEEECGNEPRRDGSSLTPLSRSQGCGDKCDHSLRAG
jgi:hypothetical protein